MRTWTATAHGGTAKDRDTTQNGKPGLLRAAWPITETRRRTVTVHESELKAPTPDDAEQTVSDWWHNGQIVLVAEDFAGVEFEAREVTETEEGGDGNGRMEQVQY